MVHHVEVSVKDIGDAMDGAAAGIFVDCFLKAGFFDVLFIIGFVLLRLSQSTCFNLRIYLSTFYIPGCFSKVILKYNLAKFASNLFLLYY